MAATGADVPGHRLPAEPGADVLAAGGDDGHGSQWSQNALLSPGFGDVPDALAGSSGGRLIALTDTGDVETSAQPRRDVGQADDAAVAGRIAAGRGVRRRGR